MREGGGGTGGGRVGGGTEGQEERARENSTTTTKNNINLSFRDLFHLRRAQREGLDVLACFDDLFDLLRARAGADAPPCSALFFER